MSIINYDLYALSGLNTNRFLKLKDAISIQDEILIDGSFSKKTLLKKGLTLDEQKKHKAFIKQLGDDSMWSKILNNDY